MTPLRTHGHGPRRRLRFAGLAAVLLALLGCDTVKGRPPVARLQIEPRYVPQGQEAVITLDGHKSCDEIDFPEGCDKTEDGPGPLMTCPGGVSFSLEPRCALRGRGRRGEPDAATRRRAGDA